MLARRVDVSDEDALFRFAEEVTQQLGPIDLWINNAGVLEPIRFARDLTARELEAHLAINVIGVLNGARAFLRQLGDGTGVLMNISSGAALRGYAGWSAYSAGKAALDRISECIDDEEPNVRAYAVAPGVIDTDMQQLIRSQTKEQFPMVDKFHALKANDAFNSSAYVADRLLEIAFDPSKRPEGVVLRLPSEKG